MNDFQQLPDIPNDVNACSVLKRLVDGIGFRYALATNNLTNEIALFRPVPSSMNIEEVNIHIFHLLRLTCKALNVSMNKELIINTFELCRAANIALVNEIALKFALMKERELDNMTIHLKRTESNYPFWYLINGYLSDILTHIGQINSWRRMAGTPVEPISPFTGERF